MVFRDWIVWLLFYKTGFGENVAVRKRWGILGGGMLFVLFINPMILYYEMFCNISSFDVTVQVKTGIAVFVCTAMLGMGIIMLTALSIFVYSLVSSFKDHSTF